LLHRVMNGRESHPSMPVTLLEPSRRLGSLRDALVWNPSNVADWIELGQRDASSITM